MEIILSQDVESLGKAGSVVKVRDGFARNFLIPRGFALAVTEVNLKKLQEEKKRKEAKLEKAKKDAQQLSERLAHTSLTLPVLTQQEDKLYGSITVLEIVNALRDEGFEIDKSAVMLAEPIKALGIYEVPLKLHPEVNAKVKVWVVKK